MDARKHKRFIVSMEAELLFKADHFACSVENLSEVGVYIITSYAESITEFPPGTSLELIVKFPDGENQRLNCKVIWQYKTPPYGVTNSIGMEILDPPASYIESLKTLM